MIVLIDGFSIAFRAFYALPETLMTSKGTPTNVIHGFLSMLNKISTDYKLEQLIVTWDLPGKTFRNDIYKDYKGNRSDAPEDLIPQFDYIRKAVKAFNLPSIEMLNYEADDLIIKHYDLFRLKEKRKCTTAINLYKKKTKKHLIQKTMKLK